jgi:hypothetical protein
MAVLGALALASLCAECLAIRADVPLDTVLTHLDAMNAARRRRGRQAMGPIEAHCQRCEAPKGVYRLR